VGKTGRPWRPLEVKGKLTLAKWTFRLAKARIQLLLPISSTIENELGEGDENSRTEDDLRDVHPFLVS
jgi:hypothetical protein